MSAGVATKMTSNESPRRELDLPPLPSSLSVTNSLLPEIQPTYKPVRLPAEFCEGSPKKKKGRMRFLTFIYILDHLYFYGGGRVAKWFRALIL